MDASESTPLLESSEEPGPLEEAQQTGNETLRHVAGPIPLSVLLILITELCERATFYGLAGPLQNYIQNKPGDALNRGALGLGQANATRINLFFNILCYLVPIPGAIIADQYLGRYKTIKYSCLIYISGLCVLFTSSLPSYQDRNLGLPGLVIALVLVGLGTGGIKSALGAWIADQYSEEEPLKIETSEVMKATGVKREQVIVDRDLSMARAFLFFYASAQIGSFSIMLTTALESRQGFPSAFFVPLPVFLLGFLVLVFKKGTYIQVPPQGSSLLESLKDLFFNTRNKTSTPNEPDPRKDDLRQVLSTCKIFLFFPFYFVCLIQMNTNLISQAGTLETHGIPNDLLVTINPLTAIVVGPLTDTIIFPFLQRYNLRPGPISRIALGFCCVSLAMAYIAILQSTIYRSPPCYSHPRHEDCHNGAVPNQIHVAAQIPAYILGGTSEIFAMVTGLEWAATRAPPSVRSLVVALFLLTYACGAGLGMLILPLTKDPLLVVMYALLSGMAGVAGLVFWLLFKTTDRVPV